MLRHMPRAYIVLGAGRQGTAAAIDLAVRGESNRITLTDVDQARAEAAADRVNGLAGRGAVQGIGLDVTDRGAVIEALEPADACLAAVSYRLNEVITEAALAAGTSLCDLGGNMDVVRRQLAMDERAREAGVALIPDCGEAPGLANNLAAYACSLLDRVEELRLYDGGIPRYPRPPWSYELTFNVDGLTNEYDATTTFVRDGRPVEVACLDPSEDEVVDLGPPFGRLEALAAATASTLPLTLGSGVRTFTSKVLRWPGHGPQFRAFRDLGLFGEEPIEAGGSRVIPREVFHALLDPRLRPADGSPDVVVARVVAVGDRHGTPAEAVVDLRVDPDPQTGLTAMQRATGGHAAIVLRLMASGEITSGAHPVERAVDPARMVAEVRGRGFEVEERVTEGPG
jgi:lysine 6-dehydrogenase